ncbi:MAG: hypothetical protein O3A00_27825 [Planctomycetota bacterium]|nr:hypothetical protein [Planctomycetota bacterium]
MVTNRFCHCPCPSTTINNVELRPGYKSLLSWNSHRDTQNQGAYKEFDNTTVDVKVSGGGESLTTIWRGKHPKNRLGHREFRIDSGLNRHYLIPSSCAGGDTLPVALSGHHGGGVAMKGLTLTAWIKESETKLGAERWYHVAMTAAPHSGQWRIRLFVNGKQVRNG